MEQNFKKSLIGILVVSIILSSFFGAVAGFWAGTAASSNFSLAGLLGLERPQKSRNTALEEHNKQKIVTVDEESAVIDTVDKVSPAVVSIIVSKDLPIIERYYQDTPGNSFFERFFGGDFGDFFHEGIPQYRQKGTEKKQIGGGSGFIVSEDGYILTNKHVVSDEEADYTVVMNNDKKFTAKVLARDPANDIAVLKIEPTAEMKKFPFVNFGDSSSVKVGQSVIAIGNSLGEFSNTVSTGVISGLSRSIQAGGYGVGSEQLTGVIQTDASINPGNSGGPLLNLSGQVIGMNTAMAQGAENIGFAIPVNELKGIYENVKENGRIVRPWIGVRYIMLDKDIAKENNLKVDYGALIVRGEARTDLAVIPGSPADKAGLVENDIILEVDGEKINDKHPLSKAIAKHSPGDEIKLKIMHQGDEKEIKVKLEERK